VATDSRVPDYPYSLAAAEYIMCIKGRLRRKIWKVAA
jgi:hypothetical protein